MHNIDIHCTDKINDLYQYIMEQYIISVQKITLSLTAEFNFLYLNFY